MANVKKAIKKANKAAAEALKAAAKATDAAKAVAKAVAKAGPPKVKGGSNAATNSGPSSTGAAYDAIAADNPVPFST